MVAGLGILEKIDSKCDQIGTPRVNISQTLGKHRVQEQECNVDDILRHRRDE